MATISWKQGATGLWTDPANWIGGVVPGPNDVSVFAAGANNDATIAAGSTVAVAGVTLAGNPDAAGANDIDIFGTLDLGGTLLLGAGSYVTSYDSATNVTASGVISGGTLDLTGGGELDTVGLNAVTLVGSPPANITFNPGTITGGLTSQVAVVNLGTPVFAGNQTLTAVMIDTGNATLSGTLTIAAGSEVENASGGNLTFADATGGGGALVNDGAIVDTSGANSGGFYGYQVDLTNAGVMSLTGTLYELSGINVTNTGTLTFDGPGELSITPATGQAFTNSGRLHIAAGGTLSTSSVDSTGGVLALDAGAEFGLSGTMTGGTLMGNSGTIATLPFAGTLDGVGIEGSLTFVQAAFTGGTVFASQTPGVRATVTVDSLSLVGADLLDDVNLTLAMLSVSQPGTIAGTAAVTLGASSDLAFQNTDTSEPSEVKAATSLTLDGTIESTADAVTLVAGSGGLANAGAIGVGAGEALSLATTNVGPIDNSGTITVAAGGTLSIGAQSFGATAAFSNEGALNLASGSTLEFGVALSAASFGGYVQSGVTVIFDGTLTGSAAPGNKSVTLPAGSVVQFGDLSTLRDVTVLDATPTTVGGTLDGVTWQGDPLDITDRGNVVIVDGLAVLSAAGGTGSIMIGGTNSVLNLQTDTTLRNVDVTIGSTLADPGTDSFSEIDGTNPTLGTVSNLTIGANASVTVLGNEFYNGLNDIGTLTVAGHVQIGGNGTSGSVMTAGLVAAEDAASAPSNGVDTFSTNNLNLMSKAQLDDLQLFDYVKQESTFDADAAAQDYTNQLGGLLDGATSPGSFSSSAARPQSLTSTSTPQTASSSATPPSELAISNETTIEGEGTFSVGNDGLAVLDAIVGAGIDLSFDASRGFFALTDPSNVAGQFNGFGAGDGIDLAFYGFDGGTVTYANGQLTIPTSSRSFAFDVAFTTGYSAADVQLADDGEGGTVAFITACFAGDTHILTDCGATAVENLQPGMRVRLASGGTRPVIWTGHRCIDCARHPRPHDVNPVRVQAHAFGLGQPARDLRLSPDHAVLINGVLIPVRYLLNDRTIVQESVASVTYWHVELDRHDVILAEGLPAESYLDTGNRSAFAECGVTALHADFRPVAMDIWAQDACAPLVLGGAELEAARSFLNMLAGQLGHSITRDPAVRILADGVLLDPAWRDGDRFRFLIPHGCADLRLLSEVAIPARIADAHPDHRRLGVMVTSIVVDGVQLDLAQCTDGWYRPEMDGAFRWRWTDGNAALPLGGRVLTANIQALTTGYVAASVGRELAPPAAACG